MDYLVDSQCTAPGYYFSVPPDDCWIINYSLFVPAIHVATFRAPSLLPAPSIYPFSWTVLLQDGGEETDAHFDPTALLVTRNNHNL